MTKIGILYIAVGEKFLKEALVSLRSLRIHCPEIPVCIKTHRCVELDDPYCQIEVVEPVAVAKSNKIRYMSQTPFEHTLFLDTDTYICENIAGMFDLLNRFELLAAYAPRGGDQTVEVDCPDGFIELNTGVLLYRKCESVMRLFEKWQNKHQLHLEQKKTLRDQPAFREMLFHSDVNFFTLPHEYNFRVNKINAARADKVYILHGRTVDLEKLARRINRISGQRAYFPYTQTLFSPSLIIGTESDGWMQRIGRVLRRIFSFRIKRG